MGIVHDFAIPFAPGVVRVLADDVALTRAFWLIRHADDRRSHRLTRLAEELATAIRREVARLEGDRRQRPLTKHPVGARLVFTTSAIRKKGLR